MQKHWTAKWIGIPAKCMIDYRRPTLPAPEFRRCFIPEKKLEHPVLFISGLGYFEWTINGQSMTSDLLAPSPTQYDKRWRYMRYKLPPMEAGKPYLFSVKLGNGMYNCQSIESPWHFDRADWRDYPKMILQLEENETPVFVSDSSWVMAYGPTLYDSFRGGEIYDARLELPDSLTEPEADILPHYEAWRQDPPADHGKWHHAWVVPSPGGIGEEQIFPGCRIMETREMRKIGNNLWEAPYQASGVPEIRVKGEAGACIKMTCGEVLLPDSEKIDLSTISIFVKDHFQEDTYILKGKGVEIWHPHFTFHGFRYVETECTGNAEIIGMRQLIMHTSMERIGWISCSNQDLKLIDECAVRANTSNFCGFPTDCPTREKNGWTSESLLMCEPLLYTHDAAVPYMAYIDTLIDTQRPSGQISGIAPCAGWGYNWGSGGHWDLALYEIPFYAYLHTENIEFLKRAYPAMKRNLEYQANTSDNGICHALGDWYPDPSTRDPHVPEGSCPSAAHIQMINIVLAIAGILGDTPYIAEQKKQLAYFIKKYNERFYLGNGLYHGKHTTYPAMALNWHIVPESDRQSCVRHLHEMVTANNFKADYGTVGSRQVPMALLENGLADDAYRLMTQPEYPGYQFMLKKRHNFTEDWKADIESMNHGAFSFVEACLYRYFAGFKHSLESPGRNFLRIEPALPSGLNDFSAEYIGFKSSWQREGNSVRYKITVPENKTAFAQLPGSFTGILQSGTYNFEGTV